MTGKRGSMGTAVFASMGLLDTGELPLSTSLFLKEQRGRKSDHNCRGFLCVLSPALRTRSQVATGSRMQDNLESELEKVRDTSGKGGGRMLSWAERGGMSPRRIAISGRDGHSKRATSPAAMPLSSEPTEPFSGVGTHTEGPNGFSQSAAHPAGAPLHQSKHRSCLAIASLAPSQPLAHQPGYGLRHNLTPLGDQ